MKERNMRRLGSIILAALIAVSSVSTPTVAMNLEMVTGEYEMSLGEGMTSTESFALSEENNNDFDEIIPLEEDSKVNDGIDNISSDSNITDENVDEGQAFEKEADNGETDAWDDTINNDKSSLDQDSISETDAESGETEGEDNNLENNVSSDENEDEADKAEETIADEELVEDELEEVALEDFVAEEAFDAVLPPKCSITINVDNFSGLLNEIYGYVVDEKGELVAGTRFNITPDKKTSSVEARVGYSIAISVTVKDTNSVPILKIDGEDYDCFLSQKNGCNLGEYGEIKVTKDTNITVSAKANEYAKFVHDSDVKIRLYEKNGRTDFDYYDLTEDRIYLMDQTSNVGLANIGLWQSNGSFYQIDGTETIFSASSSKYKNFRAYANGQELKTTEVEVIDGKRFRLFAFRGIITAGTIIEIKPYIGTRIKNSSAANRSNLKIITEGVVINDGRICVEDSSVKEIEIQINNKYPYTHTLSYVNGTSKTAVKEKNEIIEKDGVTKIYKLNTSTIADLDCIQIDESIKQNKVTVEFDKNEVDLQARSGVSVLPSSENTYLVNTNDTITFMVKAQKYYTKPSMYVDGTKVKLNSAGEFSLKITEDISLTAGAEAVIENIIFDSDEEEQVSSIKTEYANPYAYYIYVIKGAYEKIKIDKASIKIGNIVHEVNSDKSKDDILSLSNDGKTLAIKLSDHEGTDGDMAGKTYKLSYVYNDGKKNITKNVNVVVNAIPEKITIKGVDKQGVIHQMPGTRIEYPVVLDKKIDPSRIYFNPVNGSGNDRVKFYSDTKKLEIYVSDTSKGPEAIQVMYNCGNYMKAPVEIARFGFVADYSAMNNSKPIVKYRAESSTDKEIALTLTLPKSILDMRKKGRGLSSLTYHVVLTEKVEDGREPAVIIQDVSMSFQTLVESLNYTVDVSRCAPGTKFDVSVKLFNNYTGYSNVGDNEFSKETVITAATKKASIATKMSVKLTNSKIVPGNSLSYVTGRVIFNKDATDVKDYKIVSPDERLKVYPHHDDFTISCSDSDIPAGKYKFWVYSENNETLKASFDVIVQQGITSIKIDMPYVNYKKYGSALTIKPKVIFNNGLSKPVNKKIEWQLYDIDNREYVDGSKVSINKNSGVVKFAKDYKIPSNAAEGMHSFRIDAKPVGESGSYCSFNFKISAKPIVISSMVVGSYGLYEAIPDVINSNGSYHLVDSDGNLIECQNYDLSVSKGLVVEKSTGYRDTSFMIRGFTKPGKYTITATTKDGSKSVLKQTIYVGYGKTKKAKPSFGIASEGIEPYVIYINEYESRNPLNEPFTLSRQADRSMKGNDYFIEPSKVTVTGGTVSTERSLYSEKITITPTADVTTIVWECGGRRANYKVYNK